MRESTLGDPVNNIRKIAQIELAKLEARSRFEQLLDRIAIVAASAPSLMVHILLIGSWVVWNSGGVSGVRMLDPYPFGLLALGISIESLILMLVFLIRQNAMARIADRRAHLDLQLNMLTEQEATLTLRLVQRLCTFHGLQIEEHREVYGLQAFTNIDQISEVLDRHLPD